MYTTNASEILELCDFMVAPTCEDCGISHAGMSCSKAEELFGKKCVL